MDIGIEDILDCLNARTVRCTYGAVAGALGIAAVGVGRLLGEHRREASWVVNAETGWPTGYAPEDIHPDLEGSHLVTGPEELLEMVEQHVRCRLAAGLGAGLLLAALGLWALSGSGRP